MSTVRGPAQLADLPGALRVSTYNFTNIVVLSLACYCGSVSPFSPIHVFVAILLSLLIEPTTPVPSRVASQWRESLSSYNSDHNSSEMAGAPSVSRRARTTRTTPTVGTTLLFGAHTLVTFFGPSCQSQGTYHTDDTFQLRADDTALRSTLLVSALGRINFPPAVPRRPLRGGTAQAPPIRLVCSGSASMLHCTSYYGHRSLEAHAGAPSWWSSLGRNRWFLWNVWAFSFVDFFQYTRCHMGFSTYVDPSCESNKLRCFLSAENSTDTNLTHSSDPSPIFGDQQRSAASRTFNRHHIRSATNYSAA